MRLLFILSSLLYEATDLTETKTKADIAKEAAKVSVEDSDIKRILISISLIILLTAIIVGLRYLYGKIKTRIQETGNEKLKSVFIHDYELLDKNTEAKGLLFLTKLFFIIIALVSILFIVPFIFAIFPETKDFANEIFSLIMRPVKYIGKSIVDYIPNLFTIAVIILLMRYILMFCKYMAEQIKCGKLKIPGFYPEWAMSTYHILRFVLWAFTVAMIYPYLPGADSRVFQGISVLMGLLVSFGSSALISNFIAGFVITYMRPFVKGDLIKLNDTIGTVEEKTALVIRIKTKKNEVVTIPNSFMMSAQTTNYSESARSYGLIIHQEISIGYDTPWKKVEQLMIDAALSTDGVSQKPRPFVLQTSLEDYAIVYQINAYITEAERMPSLTSELLANIQDKFATAGVEIMSPEYVSVRNGNRSTIPNEDQQAIKAETQKA